MFPCWYFSPSTISSLTSSPPEPPILDEEGAPRGQRAEAIVAHLKNAKVIVALHSATQSLERFKNGKTDLIIVAQPPALAYKSDPARDKSVLARYWVDAI